MTKHLRHSAILVAVFSLFGCEQHPEFIAYHDGKLKPFITALAAVNRDSLGFTAIPEDARITLEGQSTTYDAMLHVYGRTSRTIAFKRQGNGYRWVGEQEIYTGPRKRETPDGTFDETITITFETEPISGVALRRLAIDYAGPDSTLAWPRQLLLPQALRVVKDWQANSAQ